MPLPSPSEKEERNEFISRCVVDDTIKKEFPNDKQRLAVCFSQYKKIKKVSASDENVTWENSQDENFIILD